MRRLNSLATKTATLALVAGLAAPALQAQELDLGNMTPEQRTAFGSAVRDYLLEEPQVLIEVMNLLEQQQYEQQAQADEALVSQNADALFRDGYSWVGGNPEGDVTVVEFSDYFCGYCRRAHSEVDELLSADGNIRFIYKEFPIRGDDSTLSTRFALATLQEAGPDAYKQVSDALMTMQPGLTETILSRLANTLGLETDAIMARMSDPEIEQQIDATKALARSMQINGTPTFVIGGKMYRGQIGLEAMRQAVAEERADG